MNSAMQPGQRSTGLSRRIAVAALVAALCGCTAIAPPREPTQPGPAPAPVVVAPPAPPSGSVNANISPALVRAIDYVLSQPSDHPRAAVLDFSAHSSTPRFHVIDRATGRIVQSLRVAHGYGSEGRHHDGYAEFFSNVPNSNTSSLGLYRTAEIYPSDSYPGLAMRMDGLSPTNSNARSRFIVIHAARYMEPESWQGKKAGRPGLSDGCFAFSQADRDAVLAALQGGALIYAIYEKP